MKFEKPKVIRLGKNKKGYWENDISSCCKSSVEFFDQEKNEYVKQYGHEKVLNQNPSCSQCWFPLDQTYSEIQINHFKLLFLNEIKTKMPNFLNFCEKNVDGWIKK